MEVNAGVDGTKENFTSLEHEIVSKIHCNNECRLSNLLESGTVLGLPMRESLELSFRYQFGQPHVMPFNHDRCRSTSVTKNEQIVNMPQQLMIQLKRFEGAKSVEGTYISRKIDTVCKISEYMDLESFCKFFFIRLRFIFIYSGIRLFTATDKTDKIYRLKAAVVHRGRSLADGHYIAYVRVGYVLNNCLKHKFNRFFFNFLEMTGF